MESFPAYAPKRARTVLCAATQGVLTAAIGSALNRTNHHISFRRPSFRKAIVVGRVFARPNRHIVLFDRGIAPRMG